MQKEFDQKHADTRARAHKHTNKDIPDYRVVNVMLYGEIQW